METFFMVNMADGRITRVASLVQRPSKQSINEITNGGSAVWVAPGVDPAKARPLLRQVMSGRTIKPGYRGAAFAVVAHHSGSNQPSTWGQRLVCVRTPLVWSGWGNWFA